MSDKKLTSKQKADELVSEMTFRCKECDYTTNACISANRLVDEMVNELKQKLEYWDNVKNEINIIRHKDDIKQHNPIKRPSITMDINKFKSK